MLALSARQLAEIERLHFYGRIRRFVARYCRNPRLQQWIADEVQAHALWDSLWPQVRYWSEHDCAMLLVFRAVCVCESVPLVAGALPAAIADYEVRIKKFMSERGYFRFSDFDFPLDPTVAAEGADGG